MQFKDVLLLCVILPTTTSHVIDRTLQRTTQFVVDPREEMMTLSRVKNASHDHRSPQDYPNVAVVAYCADLQDMHGVTHAVTALSNSNIFNSVNLIDGDLTTPSGEQLLDHYSCALVITDNRCGQISDSKPLAQFVNGGGGLTITGFGFSQTIGLDDAIFRPGLSPFKKVQSANGPAGNVTLPGIGASNSVCDKLLQGIDSLHFRFANHVSLAAGATLCAKYTNNNAFLAINNAGNVVGLNAFPGSQEDNMDPNFQRLLVNSLTQVCEPVRPLPTMGCRDVTFPATSNCEANLTEDIIFAAIHDESYERSQGDILQRLIHPPVSGYFGLGEYLFELSVTFDDGSTNSCFATVTVQDTESFDTRRIDCDTNGVLSTCGIPSPSFPSYTKSNGCPVSVFVSNPVCKYCTETTNQLAIKDDCSVSTDGSSFSISDASTPGTFISVDVELFDAAGKHATSQCTLCVGRGLCGGIFGSNGPSSNHGVRGSTITSFQCPSDWNPSESTIQCE